MNDKVWEQAWQNLQQNEPTEKPKRSLFDNIGDALTAMGANYTDVRATGNMGDLRSQLFEPYEGMTEEEYYEKKAEYQRLREEREQARQVYAQAHQNLVNDDSFLKNIDQMGGTLEGMAAQAVGTIGGAAIGSLVPVVGTAAGSKIGNTLGAIAGGYLDARSVALQAQEEVLDAGGTWEQAKEAYDNALFKASFTTLPETAVDIAMGNRLARAAMGSKVARNIAGSAIGKAGSAILDPATKIGTAVASKSGKSLAGRVAGIATDIAMQSGTEALQEVTQDYIANREVAKALGQQDNEYTLGGFKDYALSPQGLETMKTAGIMGGLFGGVGGAISSGQYLQKATDDSRAMQRVQQLKEFDKKTGKLKLDDPDRIITIAANTLGIEKSEVGTVDDALRMLINWDTERFDTKNVLGMSTSDRQVLNTVATNNIIQLLSGETSARRDFSTETTKEFFNMFGEDAALDVLDRDRSSVIEKVQQEGQQTTEQTETGEQTGKTTTTILKASPGLGEQVAGQTGETKPYIQGRKETGVAEPYGTETGTSTPQNTPKPTQFKDNIGRFSTVQGKIQGEGNITYSNGSRNIRLTDMGDGRFNVMDEDNLDRGAKVFNSQGEAEAFIQKIDEGTATWDDGTRFMKGKNDNSITEQPNTEDGAIAQRYEGDKLDGSKQIIHTVDDLNKYVESRKGTPLQLKGDLYFELLSAIQRHGSDKIGIRMVNGLGIVNGERVFGKIDPVKDANGEIVRSLITLYRGADAMTAVHEIGHLGYWSMSEKDRSTFNYWAGMTEGKYIARILGENYDQDFRNRLIVALQQRKGDLWETIQAHGATQQTIDLLNGQSNPNQSQIACEERFAWEFSTWYAQGYTKGVKPTNIIQLILNRVCASLDMPLRLIADTSKFLHSNGYKDIQMDNLDKTPLQMFEEVGGFPAMEKENPAQETPQEQPIQQEPVQQPEQTQQPETTQTTTPEQQKQFEESQKFEQGTLFQKSPNNSEGSRYMYGGRGALNSPLTVTKEKELERNYKKLYQKIGKDLRYTQKQINDSFDNYGHVGQNKIIDYKNNKSAKIFKEINDKVNEQLWKGTSKTPGVDYQRGLDGRWRFYFRDNLMMFKAGIKSALVRSPKNILGKKLKLSDVIRHDALYKYYPSLKYIDVIFNTEKNDPELVGNYAFYDDKKNQIVFNYDALDFQEVNINGRKGTVFNSNKLERTILHELQHAIQDYEGFASGGDEADFIYYSKEYTNFKNLLRKRKGEFKDYLKNKSKKDGSELSDEEAQKIVDTMFDRKRLEQFFEFTARWGYAPQFDEDRLFLGFIEKNDILFDRYLSILGEIESRENERRKSMTAEQWRESAPNTGIAEYMNGNAPITVRGAQLNPRETEEERLKRIQEQQKQKQPVETKEHKIERANKVLNFIKSQGLTEEEAKQMMREQVPGGNELVDLLESSSKAPSNKSEQKTRYQKAIQKEVEKADNILERKSVSGTRFMGCGEVAINSPLAKKDKNGVTKAEKLEEEYKQLISKHKYTKNIDPAKLADLEDSVSRAFSSFDEDHLNYVRAHNEINERFWKKGFYRGLDGKWRFWISDKNVKYKANAEQELLKICAGMSGKTHFKLGDLIEHDELFKYYPHLKDTDVYFENLGRDYLGEHSPYTGDIKINRMYIGVGNDGKIRFTAGGNQTVMETLLHETQHNIQTKEGFSRGGGTSDAIRSYHPERGNEANNIALFLYSNIDKLKSEIKNLDDSRSEYLLEEFLKIAPNATISNYINKKGGFSQYTIKEIKMIGNYLDSIFSFLEDETQTSDALEEYYSGRNTKRAKLLKQLINHFDLHDRVYRSIFGEIEARDTAQRYIKTLEDEKNQVPISAEAYYLLFDKGDDTGFILTRALPKNETTGTYTPLINKYPKKVQYYTKILKELMNEFKNGMYEIDTKDHFDKLQQDKPSVTKFLNWLVKYTDKLNELTDEQTIFIDTLRENMKHSHIEEYRKDKKSLTKLNKIQLKGRFKLDEIMRRIGLLDENSDYSTRQRIIEDIETIAEIDKPLFTDIINSFCDKFSNDYESNNLVKFLNDLHMSVANLKIDAKTEDEGTFFKNILNQLENAAEERENKRNNPQEPTTQPTSPQDTKIQDQISKYIDNGEKFTRDFVDSLRNFAIDNPVSFKQTLDGLLDWFKHEDNYQNMSDDQKENYIENISDIIDIIQDGTDGSFKFLTSWDTTMSGIDYKDWENMISEFDTVQQDILNSMQSQTPTSTPQTVPTNQPTTPQQPVKPKTPVKKPGRKVGGTKKTPTTLTPKQPGKVAPPTKLTTTPQTTPKTNPQTNPTPQTPVKPQTPQTTQPAVTPQAQPKTGLTTGERQRQGEGRKEETKKTIIAARKAGEVADMYKDVYSVSFDKSSQSNEENQRKMRYFENRLNFWDKTTDKDGKITYTRKVPYQSHQKVINYSGINGIEKLNKPKKKWEEWRDWAKDTLIKYLFNDKHYLAKVARKYDMWDTYVKMMVMKDYSLRANVALTEGIMYNGKRTRALNDIIKEVGEEKQKRFIDYCIAYRIKDLSKHKYWERVPELDAKGEIKRDSEGNIIWKEVELTREILQKMSVKEANEIIQKEQNGADAKLFEKNRKDFVEYNHALLHILVDGGIMSQDQFDKFVKSDPNFVPLTKVMDDTDFSFNSIVNANSLVNIKTPIKKIGTSMREVANPFMEMQKRTAEYYSIASRNRAGQIFVNEIAGKIDNLASGDVVQRGQGLIRKVKVEERNGKLITKPDDRDQIIYVCNNGEHEFYQIADKEIYLALKSLDKDQMGTIAKMIDGVAHAPSGLVRSTATMVPDFGFRNLFRDNMEAFLTSEHGFIPFVDAVWGMYQMANNTEWYQRYIEQNGEYGTLNRDNGRVDDVAYIEDIIDDKINPVTNWKEIYKANMAIMKDTEKTWIDMKNIKSGDIGKAWENTRRGRLFSLLKLAASPVWAIGKSNRRLNDYLEIGTRIGEFKNAKMGYSGLLDRIAKGKIVGGDINMATMNDIYAAGVSKDITLNFGQHGVLGKALNRYIPFFNASLQGIYKLLNTLDLMCTGTTMSGKKDRNLQAEVIFKTALISAFAIGLAAAGDGDEDYEEAPDYEKENFWIFPNGIRIPKDQVLGRMIGNAIEKSYYQWKKGEAKPSEILKNIIKNFAPENIMPAVFDIAIGGIGNYDTFYKKAIVPEYMADKLGYLQKDISTSNLSSDITEALWKTFKINISAKKMDWVIQKNLTNLGKYLTTVYDGGKKTFNPKEFNERIARGYDKNDASGSFVASLKDDVPRPLNLVTGTFATNRTTFKSIAEFYENYNKYKKLSSDEKSMTREDKKRWNRYQEAYKKDRQYRKELRAIKQDKSLTGKQKRERADRIFKQQIKLAKWAEG